MSDKQSLLLNNSLKTPLFVCIMGLNVFWWLYLIKKKRNAEWTGTLLVLEKGITQLFISFYQNQLRLLKVQVNFNINHYITKSMFIVSKSFFICMGVYVSFWVALYFASSQKHFHLYCQESELNLRKTFFHFSRTPALVYIWYSYIVKNYDKSIIINIDLRLIDRLFNV